MNFGTNCIIVRVLLITSSAIAEIDDGSHGTSTDYIITKPRYFNFQNFLKTDRPIDRPTKSPIKNITKLNPVVYLASKFGDHKHLLLHSGIFNRYVQVLYQHTKVNKCNSA